jgi:tryptophan-rich sensory protein
MYQGSQRKWLSFISFLILILVIELVGGYLTNTSVDSWYLTLEKPSWNPPGWVFGPVWTVLYILIAISGWLVWIQPKSEKRTRALWIYGVQLFLNLIWTGFFFYLQSPLLGLLDIIALLAFIIWTMVAFWPLSRASSLLLIPYLLWTAYAVTLNFALWYLN